MISLCHACPRFHDDPVPSILSGVEWLGVGAGVLSRAPWYVWVAIGATVAYVGIVAWVLRAPVRDENS